MKKVQRTTKVIPILLLALLLAVLPLAGIACGDDGGGDDNGNGSNQSFTFDMQAPYGEMDASGIALTKFKQIVEEKTNGAITINASYNGQPISHPEQFMALQQGNLSLAVQAPHFSRIIDNHFDFASSLTGLMLTKEHYQAVLANEDYTEWYSGLYEERGIKFLGLVDGYRFAGGYLTNFPCDSLLDFDGHEIWDGKPGDLEPYEEMLGCTAHVYAEGEDLAMKILNGDIDIMTIPLLYAYGGAYQTPGITHFLVRSFYAPNSILMNLDDWEKMDSELQDIIMNEVMPALEDAMAGAVIEQAKIALPGLVAALGAENVYTVTASEEDKLYNELVNFPAFKERAASMNQEMYELIKELRPEITVFDQDIIDVLTEAGLYSSFS